MNRELLDFIDNSPTPFHAVENAGKLLENKGFTRLSESEKWNLIPGNSYYVTRNLSSIIAFKIPENSFTGFMMTASHCDSPAWKIKENAELCDGPYLKLATEGYGGMICSTWMDRPLSVAGRVTVKTEKGMGTKLIDLKNPVTVIPSLAIHFNRNVNDGYKFNKAVDMVPLFDSVDKAGKFRKDIANAAGVKPEDIITTDLIVYNPEKGTEWGSFISAPRLDDLQCAFSTLKGFSECHNENSMPVYCCFDNEEVGSTTKQGAASTFLSDTLERIAECLNLSKEEYKKALANSFMLSCDNAHAVHPNHPEVMDKSQHTCMNKGIVIKYNASQKYTSDAVSAGIFQLVCERAGVPFQRYANRADMAGGSTLGNISNTQVSLNTVDIGLPQLAMHSAYETAGALDTDFMIKATTVYYNSSIVMNSDGNYDLI